MKITNPKTLMDDYRALIKNRVDKMDRTNRIEKEKLLEALTMLTTAATLLEGCRGYFRYQTAQGDKFAPDAAWEKPIIDFLEKVKTII